MKALFISNFYPPQDLGGMEQLCQEVVTELRERGHRCGVLTSRHGIHGTEQPREEDVTRTLQLQANIDYYRPLDFFVRRQRELASRRALRRALDDFQPDVICIWGMWNLTRWLAYWAEQWMPGRVAYMVASYWLTDPCIHQTYWLQPARSRWASVLLAPVQHLALRVLARERTAVALELAQVACVSEYVRRKLGEADALPHGARVIYNGIDPRPFLSATVGQRSAGEGMRLIYTGSILPHKGVHIAIEALGLLRQRDAVDGLTLTLVGAGHPDYEAQLRRRVAELGLDDQVTFYGRVPRVQIPAILASCDVFLFTSIWEEPIARTVMEAMAARLAVIGTAVGGQREMLHNEVNALVVAPENPEGLATCIKRLQVDPELRSCLAEAGRQMVLERFTLGRMVDEMETWLLAIAAGSVGRDGTSSRDAAL